MIELFFFNCFRYLSIDKIHFWTHNIHSWNYTNISRSIFYIYLEEKPVFVLDVCEFKIKHDIIYFSIIYFTLIICAYKWNDTGVKLKCITYIYICKYICKYWVWQIWFRGRGVHRCNRLRRLIFVCIQIFHSCQRHVQFRNVKMNERLTVRRECLLLKIRNDKKLKKKDKVPISCNRFLIFKKKTRMITATW